MALKQHQVDEVLALLKEGKLSARAIGKIIGCSDFTVRQIKEQYGILGTEISQLVEEEINNTIMQNKISQQKLALPPREKRIYDEALFDRKTALNMFDNTTAKNQDLINQAQEHIEKEVFKNGKKLLDHLPNLMAIGKMTETNRTMLFGRTQPREEAPEEMGKMLVYKPQKNEDN